MAIDTTGFTAWDNDRLIDKAGDLAGQNIARKLREMACEKTAHRWALIPETTEEYCSRCMLFREPVEEN